MSRVVFMCGPSGSGKTTYARRLEATGMVRLSFDSHLWARGIRSGEVDPAVREEIRVLLREELRALLEQDRDVVLDFSFWSRAMRAEWRDLVTGLGAVPETLHLATERETVLRRIGERAGSHADDFPVELGTAASYVDRFEVPTPEEGPLRVVVDDEEFVVSTGRPGRYSYDWVTHPVGYGFSSATSDHSLLSGEHHVRSIRNFLGMIDPTTGYIEDDDDA